MFSIFFFSSRRRHTRWTGDWSSDVCSSDLLEKWPGVNGNLIAEVEKRTRGSGAEVIKKKGGAGFAVGVSRSEERRVGKECRCRWVADDEKKKKRKLARKGRVK